MLDINVTEVGGHSQVYQHILCEQREFMKRNQQDLTYQWFLRYGSGADFYGSIGVESACSQFPCYFVVIQP